MNPWTMCGCFAFGAMLPMFVALYFQARAIGELQHRIATLENDIDQFAVAAINANGEVYRTHIRRTYDA